jgi:hypothetical protein
VEVDYYLVVKLLLVLLADYFTHLYFVILELFVKMDYLLGDSFMDSKMDFPINLISTEMDLEVKVQRLNFPFLLVELLYLHPTLVFLILYFRVNRPILFEILLISRLAL